MKKMLLMLNKKLNKGKKEAGVHYFDYSLLFIIIFLIGFGLVMLYSVSSYKAQIDFGSASYYLKRQLFIGLAGIVAMLIVSLFPLEIWKKYAFHLYALALFACALVPIIGQSYNNSQRWLKFGNLTIQPSEFGKIAVILFMASLLCRMPRQINSLKSVAKLMGRIAPMIGIIMLSNLSTALIIAGIAFLMIFITSSETKLFAKILVGVSMLGMVGVFAEGYRAIRIKAWLHPEAYPDASYQTIQGLYAIGSGGFFGKGLGGSIQKLGYVPEAQNDFIFSIIVEELGLFGAICVIGLFLLLIYRFTRIAMNAPDLFSSLVVVGVIIHISLQVVLNIAVVTAALPNTGVTLPFISYGGTSLFILLIEMGIVLGISRRIVIKDEKHGR